MIPVVLLVAVVNIAKFKNIKFRAKEITLHYSIKARFNSSFHC